MSKFLFETVWDLRLALIEYNQIAFDVPLTKKMLDYCFSATLLYIYGKNKQKSGSIYDYIRFVFEKTKSKNLLQGYIDEASSHPEFSITPETIIKIKGKENPFGVQGAVLIENEKAIKLYYDSYKTKNFELKPYQIDNDLLFNCTFGYLLCYTIFKQSVKAGITDKDYTIYLNRIERPIISKVTNKPESYYLGFVSKTGENCWDIASSIKAINTLLDPLELLDLLSREYNVSFIHGDLRLDNLVEVDGNPNFIDFGIYSVSMLFKDNTSFEYRGYDPYEIKVKYSICVDIFSLISSYHGCFSYGDEKYMDCLTLDPRIIGLPKKYKHFYLVAYGNLCKFYKDNEFIFKDIKEKILNIKMKNLNL